jgi:hypothetical protein
MAFLFADFSPNTNPFSRQLNAIIVVEFAFFLTRLYITPIFGKKAKRPSALELIFAGSQNEEAACFLKINSLKEGGIIVGR